MTVNNRPLYTRLQSGLITMSDTLASIEKKLAGLLCFAVFALIIGNVISRSLRLPVFWIDELAVYAMIWMALLAASSAINSKGHIAVTLITDKLPARPAHLLRKFTEFVMVSLGITLFALAWRWYDPAGIVSFAGDIAAFSATSFNFIYTEPTIATGLPKFVFWLIMPLFSIGLTLHSLAIFFAPTGSRENKMEKRTQKEAS
ncbi:MAG: TRAP transporter small permease subunit [Kordiimonadaceae bacterium]|nr:TRAP transporter small permease subunit [Kordiimonadaceae bacterium]